MKCTGCSHADHFPEKCTIICLARKSKSEHVCNCPQWQCQDAECIFLRKIGYWLSNPVSNGCFGVNCHSINKERSYDNIST